MTSKHTVRSTTSAFLLALALAGCGGGDGELQSSAPGTGGSSGSGGSSGDSSGGQQSGSSPDAFISRVIAIIDSTSETAEPEDISSVTGTKPEDAEPVPVS